MDVRVIAATNRDLEAMCARGSFRRDLLYRLNAITLTVPPLRDRIEAIPTLVDHFLQAANAANGRNVHGIGPEALALLQSYPWPGNVRELRNAIERAVVIAREPLIAVEDLPDRVRRASTSATPESAEQAAVAKQVAPFVGGPDFDLKAELQRAEVELIVSALGQVGWNQTHAARLLNIPRRTLVHKMKVLGIHKLRVDQA